MAAAVAGQAAVQLVNVNSHSLGVVAVHPRTKLKTNVVLIPKNTALPAVRRGRSRPRGPISGASR